MEYTFEQQQELNRAREAAMGVACTDLTVEEIRALNPNLLKAGPDMYEALKAWINRESPYSLHEKARMMEQALTKAEGK